MAAEWFAKILNSLAGELRISLSGGSTPKELYRLLGSPAYRSAVPWQRMQLFWGDERFVPHDSAESNYRMVQETLLAELQMPEERVHPIPVDGTPDDAAQRYEAILKRSYGSETLDSARPLFDVVFLGLGSDGHTGSLLPGQPVLEEEVRWVAPVMAGRSEPRVTLTYPTIESSRALAFLVAGSDKARALKRVREGDRNLPTARVRTHGEAIWFVDSAAASLLAG
jgi:6-phosphogluconolactonase